jgi:hypothetical protein
MELPLFFFLMNASGTYGFSVGPARVWNHAGLLADCRIELHSAMKAKAPLLGTMDLRFATNTVSGIGDGWSILSLNNACPYIASPLPFHADGATRVVGTLTLRPRRRLPSSPLPPPLPPIRAVFNFTAMRRRRYRSPTVEYPAPHLPPAPPLLSSVLPPKELWLSFCATSAAGVAVLFALSRRQDPSAKPSAAEHGSSSRSSESSGSGDISGDYSGNISSGGDSGSSGTVSSDDGGGSNASARQQRETLEKRRAEANRMAARAKALREAAEQKEQSEQAVPLIPAATPPALKQLKASELQLSPELLAAAASKIDVPATLRLAPRALSSPSAPVQTEDEIWRDFFDKEIYQKMADAPLIDGISSSDDDEDGWVLRSPHRSSAESNDCADEMANFW